MPAAAVFYGDGVNVKAARAKLAQNALVALGKVNPDVNALKVCHCANHSTRYRENISAALLKLAPSGVNVGNTVFGKIDFKGVLCL